MMKLDLKSMGGKIKAFFGDTVNSIARQTKFVQRTSDLDGVKFLQGLVFGFIEKPDASLNHLAQVCWQVELVFKLWKSYCGLARIAGWRRERGLTELYAKPVLSLSKG